METTAADAGAPGTKDVVPPTRSPTRWDGAVVAVTSAVLAYAAYLLWQQFSTCEDMDCLVEGPTATFFSAIVMPGSAWLIWALFKIPRPLPMAVTMVVIDHLLAISVVNAFGGGFDGGIGDIPGSGTGSPAVLGGPLMYILGGAAAGLAAMVLVWKAAFSRRAQVIVLALIAAESFAAYGYNARVSTEDRADALGAVSVTLYLPDISGGAIAVGDG